MLTVADVPIIVPTDELLDWIEHNIDVKLYVPWFRQSWPGPALVNLSYPTGFHQDLPTRLNTLTWPTGAARWSCGHFVVSALEADAIRKAAFGKDGKQFAKVKVYMKADGQRSDEDLTLWMYCFAPVPLQQIPRDTPAEPVNTPYLLTLVDERYYWWDHQVPDLGIVPGTTTWVDVLKSLQDELGITIRDYKGRDLDGFVDTPEDLVDPDYLYPDGSLNLTYESLPPVFDAVLFNCGFRIVHSFTEEAKAGPKKGIYRILTPDQSIGVRQADDKSKVGQLRSRMAGGDRFVDLL